MFEFEKLHKSIEINAPSKMLIMASVILKYYGNTSINFRLNANANGISSKV